MKKTAPGAALELACESLGESLQSPSRHGVEIFVRSGPQQLVSLRFAYFQRGI
jgi:hypothetical protein